MTAPPPGDLGSLTNRAGPGAEVPDGGAPAPPVALGPHLELDPDSPERGLAALVLTVVELLRQLMERQALRRIDVGDLADDDIERVGAGLMALDERMDLICQHFGLDRAELNIDLGPLGKLLSD